MDISVEEVRGPEDVAGLAALVALCRDVDGHSPLGEHSLLAAVRPGSAGQTGFAATAGAGLVGYAHLSELNAGEGWSIELAIDPRRRGMGLGTRLFHESISHACAHGGGPMNLWVYGDSAPARALARKFGFEPRRELLQFRLSHLPEGAPPPPPGIDISTFRDMDAPEWLDVNNRAFERHPENGGWTREDLEARMATDWWDPKGFLVARDSSGRMVGFCWTKLHDEGVGEIYVVATDPKHQGKGLGRFLTVAGLSSMRTRGAGTGMLYVDAENTPARRLYRDLGFVHDHTDTCWRRDTC